MNSKIKYYNQNKLGNDWVVGDIHGHFKELEMALILQGFNVKKDRLFSVGDCIDRGEESIKFLEWMEKGYFYPVRGNHENLFLKWIKAKETKENFSTIQHNYFKNGGSWVEFLSDNELNRIKEKILSLPYMNVVSLITENQNDLEIEQNWRMPDQEIKICLCHAEPPMDITDINQIFEKLFENNQDFIEHITWKTPRLFEQIKYNKRNKIYKMLNPKEPKENWPYINGVYKFVMGHHPIQQIQNHGQFLYIDTRGWKPQKNGYFTLIKLKDL